MPTLIFDIETVGEDFDSLDHASQDVLTRWIKRDAETDESYQHSLENLKNGMGFSPLTGFIVAIGVYDPDRERGAVYFQAPGQEIVDTEVDGFKYQTKTEPELLQIFWEIATKYSQFVTFNGRAFDVPFLMMRSAVHHIKPTKNLIAQRYLERQYAGVRHVDLCDQLSFYGASWRKPSLHLVCRAFGIESPKAQGVTGDDVAKLYRANEFETIARYNARDLIATAEVFKRWKEFLAA
jgi:DNA polymerase elongation subunit (family B)